MSDLLRKILEDQNGGNKSLAGCSDAIKVSGEQNRKNVEA